MAHCVVVIKLACLEVALFIKYRYLRAKRYFELRGLRSRHKVKSPGEIIHAASHTRQDITTFVKHYFEGTRYPNCAHLKSFLQETIPSFAPCHTLNIYYYLDGAVKLLVVDLDLDMAVAGDGLHDGVFMLVPAEESATKDNAVLIQSHQEVPMGC